MAGAFCRGRENFARIRWRWRWRRTIRERALHVPFGGDDVAQAVRVFGAIGIGMAVLAISRTSCGSRSSRRSAAECPPSERGRFELMRR